jgi:hypothetical protein
MSVMAGYSGAPQNSVVWVVRSISQPVWIPTQHCAAQAEDLCILDLCFVWPSTCPVLQVLKKICWYIVLSPAYSTEQGSSSDHTTLLTTTFQVRTSIQPVHVTAIQL